MQTRRVLPTSQCPPRVLHRRCASHTFAVVLYKVAVVAVIASAMVVSTLATASGHDCVLTPTGVECSVGGTTTSVTTVTSVVPGEAPRLRYVRVLDESCWYWTRFPPGLDSWDPANLNAIMVIRLRLEECRGEPVRPRRLTTSQVVSRAWEVFREFSLAAPLLRLEPATGITGLPSHASTTIPDPLAHAETLPDGTRLEVRAEVAGVLMSWGDESPETPFAPESLRPYPLGTATHVYALKTCPAPYRRTHPSGPNCHPALGAYPVTATFVWHAKYRRGGAWIDLGDLNRAATIAYDVDEAVGVLG